MNWESSGERIEWKLYLYATTCPPLLVSWKYVFTISQCFQRIAQLSRIDVMLINLCSVSSKQSLTLKQFCAYLLSFFLFVFWYEYNNLFCNQAWHFHLKFVRVSGIYASQISKLLFLTTLNKLNILEGTDAEFETTLFKMTSIESIPNLNDFYKNWTLCSWEIQDLVQDCGVRLLQF